MDEEKRLLQNQSFLSEADNYVTNTTLTNEQIRNLEIENSFPVSNNKPDAILNNKSGF